MRKVFTFMAAVLLTATVWAQSPEKMSYQAIIRNSDDALVTNTSIGMQISILLGSADGPAVYEERHFPTTNGNGLVTIEIGNGSVVSGDMSTIDWADNPYFIKTETDINGGANYTITGTSQLLSVPYALHAKTAESINGTITETDPVFTEWDKDYDDLINTPVLWDSTYTSIKNTPDLTVYSPSTHGHAPLADAYGYINRYDIDADDCYGVESVSWNATSDRFEIAFTDFYFSLNDIAVVTIRGDAGSCPAGTVARHSSVSGDLLVYMVNSDGDKIQCSFSFVVFSQ